MSVIPPSAQASPGSGTTPPPVRDARQAVEGHYTAGVRTYYDENTQAYLDGFGEIFQGSRPASTEDLMRHIADGARLYGGQRVLDAGCGVCGPATWLARHCDVAVEALTLSEVQVQTGRKRVAAQGLQDKVSVRVGDFHRLTDLYAENSFDRVLFLESICHAQDYRAVLHQAWQVLKPGGLLYIKDFYGQDFRTRPELAVQHAADMRKLNEVYQLVMPDLASLVDVVLEPGFKLHYVREPAYEAVFEPWLNFEQRMGKSWSPEISYLELITAVEILVRKPG